MLSKKQQLKIKNKHLYTLQNEQHSNTLLCILLNLPVPESNTKQPVYCRSLCSPIRNETNSKDSKKIDAYLQRKKLQVEKKGIFKNNDFISFF